MTMAEPERSLRLVVVDDHSFAREAVAAMLDDVPGLEAVGHAGSLWEARELIEELAPDVAVVDLRLPDGSGRELIEHFAIAMPQLRCLIFTSAVDQYEADALLQAGAEAVILKSLRGTDLIDAILQIHG